MTLEWAQIYMLQKSAKTYEVRFNVGATNNADGRTINWDPWHSIYTTNGGCLSPLVPLGHELDHAAGSDASPSAFAARLNTFSPNYDNLEEKRVITGTETSLQRMLRGKPRYDHRADTSKGIRGVSSARGFSPAIGVCK